ncbi:MAG: helix-turn-helix transcriptional regulator [Thermaceae bacterium]|nr:helix-turn-helix transcriptional regulator [Thermaceae bacterium]
MVNTHFKLEPLLRQHRTNPLALAEASGLSKTTVYNIVNNKTKAIELQTLDKLMAGLEKLLGRPVTYNEVFERPQSSKQERLEQLLKGAKPFSSKEWRKEWPAWTPEEQAENEAFLQVLAEARKADMELSAERDRRLLELFDGPESPKTAVSVPKTTRRKLV